MTKYMRDYEYDPYVICSNQGGELPAGIDESHIFRLGGAEKDLGSQMSVLRRISGKLISLLPFYLRSVNRESLYWYWLVRDHIKEIESRLPKPDHIIGSYGPISDIYVAGFLSRRWRVPWIADLRDYISDWDGHEEKKHFKGLDTVLEKRLLKDASGMTVISKGIQEICQNRYPSAKICLAYNGWEQETESPGSDSYENKIPYRKYLYYAGNIYDHQYKCMELVVRAYTSAINNGAAPIPLVIRKAQNNETWTRVELLVKNNGLEEYIRFLPGTTSGICHEEAIRSEGNLVFGTLDSQGKKCLIDIPAKTFELMSMKKPICLIDNESSELADLIDKTESGTILNSQEEIRKIILEGCKAEYSWKNIDLFSRKKQAENICRFVDCLTED